MLLNINYRHLLVVLLSVSVSIYGQEQNAHNHTEEQSAESGSHIESSTPSTETGNRISLTTEQINLAGIKVETLKTQPLQQIIYAPAEIKANGYTSYIVSPRVDSVVLKRHVSLGEHVNKGQPLVTLFSEIIAQAQAEYRINFAEWNRVRQLGKSAVSEKNISEAQTGYIASLANLKAFGLSDQVIAQLSKDNSSALGEYTLEAAQSGSVLNDDFQQGQRVEAGQSLMILADETELWVEARLSPNTNVLLPSGSNARLDVGNKTFSARVIQEAHTIDSLTRTRVVRLSVLNQAHLLHPGMFGDVFFNINIDKVGLTVPETALIRGTDGDWQVFVQIRPGEFQSQEVELGQISGNRRQIKGITAGRQVVIEGAFFVASEQAKSGFDPHNH